MNKFFVLLALVALVGLAAVVDAGSGSKSREKKRESCGCLVTKVEPTATPAEPSPSPTAENVTTNGTVKYDCPLIRGLLEILEEMRAEDDPDCDDLEVAIDEIQAELQDSDDNSKEQDAEKHGDHKCVKASHKLKKHLKKNKNLKKKIHYKDKIKGCNGQRWVVRDFITVSIEIQSEIIVPTITLDIDDDCPLFRAIRNGSEATGNATVIDECEELIEEIKVVLKCGCGYSREQEMGMIHKIMKKKHRVLMETLLVELEIEDFGPMESFIDVCKVELQILTVKKALGDGPNGEPPAVIRALRKIQEDVTIEITIRVTIKQMCDSMNASMQESDDVLTRLSNCSGIIHEFRKLAPWTEKHFLDANCVHDDCNESSESDEDGDGDTECVWGDIYELEFCSNMCTNYGTCGGIEEGEGTPPPNPSNSTSSPPSGSPSSPSPPSPTPSSPATGAQTTTPPSCVGSTSCGCRGEVVEVKSVCGCSRIIISINITRMTWPVIPMRTSFSSVWSSINEAVYDDVKYPPSNGMKAKINRLITVFDSWNAPGTYNGKSYKENLKDIVITHSNGVAWGKVRDFMTCGAVP